MMWEIGNIPALPHVSETGLLFLYICALGFYLPNSTVETNMRERDGERGGDSREVGSPLLRDFLLGNDSHSSGHSS